MNNRIQSLDQFRGYTVLGMLLVNFLGGFAAVPEGFKHHNTYNSYADTIMPHFFFAVGFAYRLTFLRRYQIDGPRRAYARVLRRLLGLFLIALIVHSPGGFPGDWSQFLAQGPWSLLGEAFKSSYFQTLLHITVASLWVTPVVRANARIRIGYGIFSGLLHLLLSWWFNFAWVWESPRAIDGGPLGFLTWSLPLLGGTLACDLVTTRFHAIRRLVSWGGMLVALGWIVSCGTRMYDVPGASPDPRLVSGIELGEGTLSLEPVFPSARARSPLGLAEPPFVPPPRTRLLNYWMMSQRAGTLSYQIFSTGLSLWVFALFYVTGDRWGRSFSFLRTLGSNALVAYILHGMIGTALQAYAPENSPVSYLLAVTITYVALNYLLLRALERQAIFLRI